MSRNLSVVEPHPTVPSTGNFNVYGGRGGAGNFKRYRSEDLTSGPSAQGPASRISLSKTFTKRTTSQPTGRGGAGNMFRYSKDDGERVFQFDEEMVKRRETQAAPVYHIGRGGAANYAYDESSEQKSVHRQPLPVRTERLNSTASTMSSGSEASATEGQRRSDGAFAKLARRFS